MIIRYTFLIFITLFFINSLFSQGLVNNGATIVITSSSYLVVDGAGLGNYLNKTNSTDGAIDIDGTMILKGDWTNNAANNVFINRDVNGDVSFSSSGNQNINGTTKTIFENLTINNSNSGTSVSLGVDVEVSSVLTLTDGIVTTSSNKVIVTNTATASVSGATSGTDKYVNGNLQRSTVAGTYTFPVGAKDIATVDYGAQGFDFTVNTGSGDVLAFMEANDVTPVQAIAYCDLESNPGGGVVNASDGTIGYDGILDKIEFNLESPLQWNISNPGGGVSDYDLTVNSNGLQDITGVTTVNGLEVKYLMKNGEPGNAGVATGTALPSFSATGFLACPNGKTLTGLTSFSKFTHSGASKASSILPIELLNFNAKYNSRIVNLIWTTANEKNNDFFTIEKSNNGNDFSYFGIVDGAGNSNSILKYSFNDNEPFKGFTYYRLKQTDFDGKSTYSNIVSVNIMDNDELQSFWFNKENQELNIEFNSNENTYFMVCIYDLCGKQLINKTANIEGKMNFKVNLNVLPAGIYSVSISSKSNSYIRKVVIN